MKRWSQHSQSTPESGVASLDARRRHHGPSLEQVLGAYNDQVPALRSEWTRVVDLILTSGPITQFSLGQEHFGYTIPTRSTSFSLRDPSSGAMQAYEGTGKVYGVLHPKATGAQEAVRTLEAVGANESVILNPRSRPLLFSQIARSTITLCVERFSPDVPAGSQLEAMLYCEANAPVPLGEKLAENSMQTHGPEGAQDYLREVAAAHFRAMGVIAAVLEPPLPTHPPSALA